MTTSYYIAEQQLARTFHGVPERAWLLPDDAMIQSIDVGDFGGDAWVDVITLTDGRVVLVGHDGAAIYPSIDAAYDCAPNEQLQEV